MQRSWIVCVAVIVLSSAGSPAVAAEIALAGVFGRKAVIVVGGPPRTLSVGQVSPEGVRLLDVSSAERVARVEYEGVIRELRLGQTPLRLDAVAVDKPELVLSADARGHHFAQGSINGAALRFMVDTGASMISLGRKDAERVGIDYRRGTYATAQTASGPADAWLVRLDAVQVGAITLYGVDAIILDNDLPFVLLGMSFLSRTEMRHEGSRMILRKRY